MAGYVMVADLWVDGDNVRHERGEAVAPPADEVDRLMRAGAIAVAVDDSDGGGDETPPTGGQATQGGQVPAGSGQTPPPPSNLERPKQVAPKADWVEYGVAQAVAAAEAAGESIDVDAVRAKLDDQTKQELVEALS